MARSKAISTRLPRGDIDNDSAWAVGDYSGDGRTDLYFLWTEGNNGTNRLYSNPSLLPDRMVSLANGLGATTTIAYTPSSAYDNLQLPFPLQTVSKIATDDGYGNVSETTYAYAGGFYHIGEREFRGFQSAKMTGPLGPFGERIVTDTWFHQGNDTAVDVNQPDGPRWVFARCTLPESCHRWIGKPLYRNDHDLHGR